MLTNLTALKMQEGMGIKIKKLIMEYKVVPFVASIDPKKGTSEHVAEQLDSLIKTFTDQGWKYIRLESVTTFVQPDAGCFGFGAKPGFTTTRQMVVFEK